MKVALAREMKQIDRLAQDKFGISGIVLMERAALAARDELKAFFGNMESKKIYIFCGKGNNGGDGLALARLLLELGALVTCVLAYSFDQYQGLARENLILAQKFGVKLLEWGTGSAESNQVELSQADIIVDALLGTGSSGPPKGVLSEIINAINMAQKPVLALDIPSGIDVDSGNVDGLVINATRTITFGLPKPGLLCYPGAEYTGVLEINSIGFPKELLESEQLKINLLTQKEVKEKLPRRPAVAHKGITGHVLIIAGSRGMTGAAVLASLAALRSGCGLVTVGLRGALPFPEKPPEVMVIDWEKIDQQLDDYRCVVFGPGLSIDDDGKRLLFNLAEKPLPMIIDADGLNILAREKSLLSKFKKPIVLTPHPGEMSRLTDIPVREIQADRIGIARRFAKEWRTTIVLKGARTIIAFPEGEVFINYTGNPGMATAGMGDALAGIIGGLLAQGLELNEAAVVGTYIHGLAGDLLVQEKGLFGIIASDLLQEIPYAIKKILE